MTNRYFFIAGLLGVLAGSASWAAQVSEAGGPGPLPVVRGLASADGLAVNAQGFPFVAVARPGTGIFRIVAPDASRFLTETGGEPGSLAFDASGNLYVAVRDLEGVYRVTPWGEPEVIAEWGFTPEGITVGPGGDIYVADSEGNRLFRLTPKGKMTDFITQLTDPISVVISNTDGHVFVGEKSGTIWRFNPEGRSRSRFAVLQGKGEPAGMALDAAGNLYVARDGGGKVTVLNPRGEVRAEYQIPGPRVTAVAFGGYDLNVLYVAEAEAGVLYKLHLPHRSQRLLWETDDPLRITDPPDGAILNRHDGKPAADGLRITVRGTCAVEGGLRVNDVPVAVRNGAFETQILLQARKTEIVAEGPGGLRDTVTVLWDRDSFPRYRFSTDDDIVLFKDIAAHADTYTSIFDNPYLAFWREMNRKYGTKVHHNIYCETAGFNLSQMPDKFRSDWQSAKDWMRLTFHARANNPPSPYIHSSAEQIRRDYRLVVSEIERFAGKELLSPATTLHWATCTRAAARALREEGVKILLGVDRFRNDLPRGGYYLSLAQRQNIVGREYWKDTEEDIIFIHHDMVVNNVPLDEIVPRLEQLATDPHESEVIELIIHEEQFHPEYMGYVPDYRQRVERAIQWVTSHGYKPVFFSEGFLGTSIPE